MHGKFGLLSPGKVTSHSTALPRCFFPHYVQCFRVSIPPAVRLTLLRQMDMGSLTCAQIWVLAVHAKGGQAQTSLHKSVTQKNRKTVQGMELRVLGFEFLLYNH